ncbi:ABC transporter permease [Streptomyces xylophagus]|uniref:ABC transporter permease n=1 Tax=Streptomyces xylophagus TaxID=285514 RepID=UPI0005BB5FB8|nr:ABC transporter permease [Streptomyces xylophagus]
MTTLAHPRPRPQRAVLRLHRPALLGWAVFVIVVCGLLLCVGGPLTDTAVMDPAKIQRYKDWNNYTTSAVLAAPFLIAAWSGATLTSRELENGTAQLAWTQSISPARWLTAKLALPAVLITVGSGLLVGLHHWAWSRGQGRTYAAKQWHNIGTYSANGTTVVALALSGLVAGALLGLLTRSSPASLAGAMCVPALLWGAVTLATPYLWPTVTTVSSLKLYTAGGSGMSVSEGLLTSTGARIADPGCGSDTDKTCRTLYEKLDAVSYFNDYHPYSHYWPLQLTATAIVLAVTAAMTVAAFRLLKRRTGPAPARKAAAV